MFRDSSSALFASRKTAMNNGTGSLLASAVDTSSGMAETVFADGSDTLESTPHDDVHVGVGGLMGSVSTSAQDPLFYLHHCNMDRLWNTWLAQGGGRHNPLSDTAWKNDKFTFFDENGAEVKMSGCQVLRAALQLNYKYEGEPAQVNSYCLRVFKPMIVLQKEILFRLPDPQPVLRSERFRSPSKSVSSGRSDDPPRARPRRSRSKSRASRPTERRASPTRFTSVCRLASSPTRRARTTSATSRSSATASAAADTTASSPRASPSASTAPSRRR